MQGYYSLIQYCPDWLRLEVCNLGVLLYCPERNYLNTKMCRNFGRIHSIFGKDHSLNHVKTFSSGIAARIETEKPGILNLDALENFIARRANSFLITKPRSIAINDPDDDLNELYEEVFGKEAVGVKKKGISLKQSFLKILKEKIGPEFDNRVARYLPKIEIPVPGLHQKISPCLGYPNGVFNVVVSENLRSENAFQRLSYNMAAGKFLYEKPHPEWGRQRLTLLADTSNAPEVKQQVSAMKPMLSGNHVELFTDPEMMADRIINESHPLPESLLKFTKPHVQMVD